jgi:hypothetical protein
MPATSFSVDGVSPLLHCTNAMETADWYSKLGFETAVVHRFEPDAPRLVTLRANDLWLLLSEHEGEACPGALSYLHVDDADEVACHFGATARDLAHGTPEVHFTDPAGHRVRVGLSLAEA